MTDKRQAPEVTDSDRLWEAMLAVWPHVGAGVDPRGRAHLVQEHATALIVEWRLATAVGIGRSIQQSPD